MMFKSLIELYIRASKNPDFYFDDAVGNSLIISLTAQKILSLLRGIRLSRSIINSQRIFLGKSVQLFNKKNITVGNNVSIGDYSALSALGRGNLSIENNVSIGAFSRVVISTSFNDIGEYIHLNKNVSIGEYAYLGGAGGLEIGSDTIIGQYFSTHPENHNYQDRTRLIRKQGVNRQGIKIGENCWIGAKVTVLDGVVLGNNCVIAAGAVVTKSFGDDLIIGGVPAKIIRQIP